ncbi:MAG: hypothetical protein ACRDOG_09740 [Gaiellaceae bacterium]
MPGGALAALPKEEEPEAERLPAAEPLEALPAVADPREQLPAAWMVRVLGGPALAVSAQRRS